MTLPTEAVTLAGSGLVFVNYYDASVSSAYRSAIIGAENALQGQFTNAVTVNVQFNLQPLGSNTSAQNVFDETPVSYAAFTAALRSHATSPTAAAAVNGLPAADPSKGVGFNLPTAQAVMLGLATQTNVTEDTVTLNSSLNWTFGQDAIGSIEHELTEGVFGRTSSLGFSEARWNPMDLFRFTASGQRDYTGGSDGITTYFGINASNVTTLAFHSAIGPSGRSDGQDLGDWEATFGDAFGPGGPGAPGMLSPTDLQVLNVLGWNPAGTGAGYQLLPSQYATSLSDTAHPFGQLIVGGSAKATLEYAGNHDWFAVQLVAGATYMVRETGVTGGGGTLADPFLQLHDASGNVVASNDDVIAGSLPDSQISFFAPASGVYYVDAGAFADGYTGSYTVSVTQTGQSALAPQINTAFSAVTRAGTFSSENLSLATSISQGLAAGTLTQAAAVHEIVQSAENTTSVSTIAYQFFAGSTPSAAGLDYLVSPTGPNPNNLNSTYYQSFNIENRYINFAVDLGKLGAGAANFQAQYGSLNLTDATSQAYATLFGETPSAAKVASLLGALVPDGLGGQETRADYFAFYGQDGPNGLGTKAAMVGWLMAEGVKADVGDYALSNDAYLTDIANGVGTFAVNMIGHYDQPAFHYTGP